MTSQKEIIEMALKLKNNNHAICKKTMSTSEIENWVDCAFWDKGICKLYEDCKFKEVVK